MTEIDATTAEKSPLRDRIIEYGILALVAFSPLPAGSVPDWSILVIELGILTLAAVRWLPWNRAGWDISAYGSMKWPARLWTGFVLFLIVQVLPLPCALVRILSPEAYARKISYASGPNAWMSLSLVPDRTLRTGLLFTTCILLGALITATMRRRSRAIRLIWALVGMGLFESLYGLLQLNSGNPNILFYPKAYNVDSVTGTFVNRNHLSGYLEMVIPLALGLIVARTDLFSASHARLRDKALQMSEKRFLVNTGLFLSVLIMGLGVIFSKSRSGVFIFVLIFLLFFGGILIMKERLGERKKSIVLSLQILFAVIVGAALYAGTASTLARFGMDKFLKEQRPQFWGGTLRQFSRFPIFGTGLGTFPAVYPGSEENGMPIHIYHAHNDYLEFLSELGVVGSLLLFGALGATLVQAWHKWKKRRRPEVRSLALGGLVAALAMLIHGMTDFNMQIPANLVLFTIIISLTIAVVNSRGGAMLSRPEQAAGVEDGIDIT